MTILNIIYLGFLVFFLACVAQGDVAKERSRRVTITVMDAKCRKFQDFKIERYELDGKMCLYWSKGAKNFTDAKKDCEAQGARLGVFKGAEKMQILIRQNVIWKRNFWIGLDDLVTEGTLVWHDGTILPRSDYYPLYFNACKILKLIQLNPII
nr:C-type lectin domain family 4 member M-like; partial [Biomphalaria glabrata]